MQKREFISDASLRASLHIHSAASQVGPGKTGNDPATTADHPDRAAQTAQTAHAKRTGWEDEAATAAAGSLAGQANAVFPVVPAFAEQELSRLYRNIYCSLPFFEIYGLTQNAETYVGRRDGDIDAVFLFRREGKKIRVLNELTDLDRGSIDQFCRHVFDSDNSIDAISFYAVAVAGEPAFPSQRFHYTEDIVLALPSSAEDYHARLGAATRKNVRKYVNRAQRSFPSFRHRIAEGAHAEIEDIRAIVGFNRLRMAQKNKSSSIDDAEVERLARLVARSGFISVIEIDGEVRAGAIVFQVGDRYYSRVNAHDPAYDDFRLGTSCCYLTILECIRRNGQAFHFLWGRNEYKFALLGELKPLDQIHIYRSWRHLLQDAPALLRLRGSSQAQLLKFRLLEESKKDSRAGHALRRLLSLRGRAH